MTFNKKYPKLHELSPPVYDALAYAGQGTYTKMEWLNYFIQSNLLHKAFIHVIGDSHVASFNGSDHFFTHHLGAVTAYNLRQKVSSTQSNRKLFKILQMAKKKDDIILLVFGEIDCRIHIYNQFMKNKGKYSIEQLIETTITSYGEVLKRLKEMKFNFFVYGIPPASSQGNIYNYKFYATPEQRSKISRKFNELLKRYCEKNGYRYIDIYSKTCNEKGFIKREYDADGLHLNRAIVKFVIEKLKEYGIDLW